MMVFNANVVAKYIAIIFIILVIVLLTFVENINDGYGDHYFHSQYAMKVFDGTSNDLPHPLFHRAVIMVYPLFSEQQEVNFHLCEEKIHLKCIVSKKLLNILPSDAGHAKKIIDFYYSGLFVVFIFTFLLCVSLFLLLSFKGLRVALLFSFGLMLVHPITLLTYPNQYLGYIAANVYHNPTIVMAKPLALFLFMSVMAVLTNKGVSFLKVIAIIVFVFLSALSKPSYIIALIPVVLLVMIYKFYMKEFVSWRELLLAFFLPSVAILAWQYFLTYSSSTDIGASITFSPLSVLMFFEQRAAEFSGYKYIFLNTSIFSTLIYKLLLSLAFPLVVYIVFFGEAIKSLRLNVSWLTFIVSVMYFYLLSETGERASHGNFLWGAQISLFILFVVSVQFLFERWNENNVLNYSFYLKLGACFFMFGFHVVSGIYFLLYPSI